MPTTTTQAAFLANSNNKKRLIQTLSEKMLMSGILVKQAEADADTLIVSTALAVAEAEEVPVVVVGTDTDLLVMMVARASASIIDVYMKCCSNPEMVFSIRHIQHAIGETIHRLMALHAITGCDGMTENMLKLNSDKTEFFVATSPHFKKNSCLMSIYK